ncbi:hypothetical protein IW261DRAFT_1424555 [Armillaria novae-zelandiae]|uniref:Uncharacterized protein n=1 Tax=Armillaria novae-zelandiae TaxID=153914 RepID=A0AA39NUN0_9AGAR|nr:hypothetical protein IW261DRAFT_1424555 [Armillaria novae-zelandiae]
MLTISFYQAGSFTRLQPSRTLLAKAECPVSDSIRSITPAALHHHFPTAKCLGGPLLVKHPESPQTCGLLSPVRIRSIAHVHGVAGTEGRWRRQGSELIIYPQQMSPLLDLLGRRYQCWKNRSLMLESWITALVQVTEEELKERSKADGSSKSITIVPIFWFVLQCLARLIWHLPIVSIELDPKHRIAHDMAILLPLGAKLNYTGHDHRQCVGLLRCNNGWYYHVLVAVYGCSDDDKILTIETAWANSALFGSMYLVDWSYEFASDVERIFWGTSAITITSIPLWRSFLSELTLSACRDVYMP